MWPLKKRRSGKPTRRRPIRRQFRWSLLALLVFAVGDAVYLATLWPDWEEYRSGPVPASNFIRNYRDERQNRGDWPPLQWRPVAIGQIPRHLIRAVIVAEDARFYEHDVVVLEAL